MNFVVDCSHILPFAPTVLPPGLPTDVLKSVVTAAVTVVRFNSAVHTVAELIMKVTEARATIGKPFASIAVANHGTSENGKWQICTDLSVYVADADVAATELAPVIEPLIAILEQTKMGVAHIDFLACSLATASPNLIPTLEQTYGVDFRASTDATSNKGNWTMETDGAVLCVRAFQWESVDLTAPACSTVSAARSFWFFYC